MTPDRWQRIEELYHAALERPEGELSTRVSGVPMVGKTISHYRILEKIGSGGMGEVYRATDLQLHREVAVKVLPISVAADEDRLRRFQQEARTASMLNHPNILVIYEFGFDDGAPYAVSELLDGQTLGELLKAGPVPVRKAVDFAAQIARGL